jgi:hypothetical protein
MDEVELISLGVPEEPVHSVEGSDCRDEHVIIVEEGLASFDRVFSQFGVLGADVVMPVEVGLPAGYRELLELLDVRYSGRWIDVVER